MTEVLVQQKVEDHFYNLGLAEGYDPLEFYAPFPSVALEGVGRSGSGVVGFRQLRENGVLHGITLREFWGNMRIVRPLPGEQQDCIERVRKYHKLFGATGIAEVLPREAPGLYAHMAVQHGRNVVFLDRQIFDLCDAESPQDARTERVWPIFVPCDVMIYDSDCDERQGRNLVLGVTPADCGAFIMTFRAVKKVSGKSVNVLIMAHIGHAGARLNTAGTAMAQAGLVYDFDPGDVRVFVPPVLPVDGFVRPADIFLKYEKLRPFANPSDDWKERMWLSKDKESGQLWLGIDYTGIALGQLLECGVDPRNIHLSVHNTRDHHPIGRFYSHTHAPQEEKDHRFAVVTTLSYPT